MEQSDIDLLQSVPSYHLQTLLARRETNLSTSSPPDEIAGYLFAPGAISAALDDLSDLEQHVLRELVACGGRANSRDLALYLTFALPQYLSPGQSVGNTQTISNPNTVIYPTAHPHGPYEQALHRLLAKSLIFWGKHTNFAGRDYTNGVYDGVLIVPHAVRQAVRDRFDTPSQAQDTAPAEPVILTFDAIEEGIRSFQRALYLYWSTAAAARGGLPLVSSGLLTRAALRQVIDALGADIPLEQIRSETDAPRLLFMRLLLLHLNLLQTRDSGGSRFIVPAPAARSGAFFARPLLERARICLRAWLEGSFWNELAYLPNVVTRPGPQPLEPAHEEVIHARRAVIDLCIDPSLLSPGSDHKESDSSQPTSDRFVPVSAFIARAKLYAPHLLFPRQYGARADRYTTGSNPYGWDFRLRHGWLAHREGWHMVEGGFIRSIIAGPLRWLGLTETSNENTGTRSIAPHENAGTRLNALHELVGARFSVPQENVGSRFNGLYFRVSPLLPLLLAGSPPVSEDIPWGKLIVQPNFDLIALAPVSEALLVKLDRFAERLKLEHIAQYRLSKASVTRAIQRGMRADDILRDLYEAAAAGADSAEAAALVRSPFTEAFAQARSAIPQNVRYSLAEWERQARRVEMWEDAALIEVDDPSLLDELFSEANHELTLMRRLSPVLAQVSTAHLPGIQRALWQRGYLPIIDGTDPQFIIGDEPDRAQGRIQPQWRLRDDGLLQPLYAVTDLYLASAVAPFTEQDELTGWRKITPSSLQNAIDNGKALNNILRCLQAYCAGGIPASLLIRLKLWGGGYEEQASIRVEDTPMLYLSKAVLRDIQADDAINTLLGEAVAPDGRLVRVPRAHLEHVLALLRQRGFDIIK